MTPHEREGMQAALDVCRKDYLHAIESINLEIRLGACRIRTSELTVKHDEIVQRIKQIDRACLAQPKSAECDGGQCGIGGYCKQCPKTQPDVPETAFGETEPVAWMYDWTTSDGEFIQDWTTSEAETLRDTKPNIISNIRPLYTTPPQREWVGLTHKEHMEIMTGTMTTSSRMAAVEAKLKEKNT